MRVALRPLAASDAAWLDAWFPAVAASVGYGLPDATAGCASLLARSHRERSLRVDVIERSGLPEGVIVVRRHAPRRSAATVEIVAASSAASRRGIGMATASLLEEELRAAGVRTLYAPAPAVHGIAMYFWIRLGYRPLLRGEWPCERQGVAWLRRDL